MQTAENRVSDDRSRILLELLRVTRDSLVDSLVRSSVIEVVLVLPHDLAEMALI
jgi:hypothetical protein